MDSGVAWQPLLLGWASVVPGGSALLTNGSVRLCPGGEAEPTAA